MPPSGGCDQAAQSINEKARTPLVQGADAMIPEIVNSPRARAVPLRLPARLGSRVAAPAWLVDGRGRPARRAIRLRAIAFGCLTYAFVANDFTVAYVASNSFRAPVATASLAYGAARRLIPAFGR